MGPIFQEVAGSPISPTQTFGRHVGKVSYADNAAIGSKVGNSSGSPNADMSGPHVSRDNGRGFAQSRCNLCTLTF